MTKCKRMLGGWDSSESVIGIDREGYWGYALE